MKKSIILIITITLINLKVSSQDIRQQIQQFSYYGYIHNSPLHFNKALELANQEYNNNDNWKSSSGDDMFSLAMAYYGVLNSTMAGQDEETFDKYVDQTMEILEYLLEKRPEWGEPYAVLASVHGLRMGYSPWKGMYLGPISNNLMEKALKYQPDSPLVLKLHGISKLYTPEMFGGDTGLAIKSLESSIKQFESNPGSLSSNWMYLDALAFLGQAYSKNDQPAPAIQVYRKALEIEPEFAWLKQNLLPNALKKSE